MDKKEYNRDNFCAKALLVKRNIQEQDWVKEYVTIHNIGELRQFFKPYENYVSQIDIDNHRKVYTCIDLMENGIDAKLHIGERVEYLVNPLLIVECNDTYPIDLSDTVEQDILSNIDLL